MVNIMTEKEIIEKINKNELNVYQLTVLKDNGAVTLTDNILWAVIKKEPDCCSLFETTREMKVYALVAGAFSNTNKFEDSFYLSLKEGELLKILDANVPLINATNLLEILEKSNLTETIIKKVAKRFPIFLTSQKLQTWVTDDIKWIAINSYCENTCNRIFFVGYLGNLTDEMWKKLCQCEDRDFLHDLSRFIIKHPVPDFVKEKVICSSSGYYTACKIRLDEKMLKTFFDKWYGVECAQSSFKEILNGNKSRLKVLESYPDLYRYIRNPRKKETELAVSLKPENLRYVKKQTEELCLTALKKDKSVFKYVKDPTDAILNFMGFDRAQEKAKYTAPYYLVKSMQDLADEGYLVCVKVITKEGIEEFMNSKFELSFGNLYDNEKRDTDKCFSCIPITEEEYILLKKLGLDSIKAGYWDFELEENEEDD